MSDLSNAAAVDLADELQTLRRYRLWFLVFGIAMVAFGTFVPFLCH